LKAGSIFNRLTADPLVIIDNENATLRPAQADCPMSEFILQFGGFAIIDDLVLRGLPNIDHGQPFQVSGMNFVRGRRYMVDITVAHASPPGPPLRQTSETKAFGQTDGAGPPGSEALARPKTAEADGSVFKRGDSWVDALEHGSNPP
jgi:hypothetical protein